MSLAPFGVDRTISCTISAQPSTYLRQSSTRPGNCQLSSILPSSTCVNTQLNSFPPFRLETRKCKSGPINPLCESSLTKCPMTGLSLIASPENQLLYTAYPLLFGLSSNPSTIFLPRLLTPSAATTTSA